MKIEIEQIIRETLGFTEADKFIKTIEDNDLEVELEKLIENIIIITEKECDYEYSKVIERIEGGDR